MHLPNGLINLPRKLRYLRWDGYPLKTMPSRFCPEFLVELCMSNSNLEKLWDGIQVISLFKLQIVLLLLFAIGRETKTFDVKFSAS